MKIAIIILHYGEIQVTKKCIRSIQRFEKAKHDIIVVNNTKEKFFSPNFSKEKVIVINNKANFGFAKGVNQGIRFALKKKYRQICLLNNDTVFTKNTLEKLSNQMQKNNIDIISPAIYFEKNNNKMYDLGGYVNSLFLSTHHKEVTKLDSFKIAYPTYISGCCMLIQSDVFGKVGLFDESFFLYYEDVDFCLRARQKDFVIGLDTEVAIEHELSKSAGKMSSLAIYHLTKSSIIFGKKYGRNVLQRLAHKSFILFQSALFLKANPSAAAVIAKALISV